MSTNTLPRLWVIFVRRSNQPPSNLPWWVSQSTEPWWQTNYIYSSLARAEQAIALYHVMLRDYCIAECRVSLPDDAIVSYPSLTFFALVRAPRGCAQTWRTTGNSYTSERDARAEVPPIGYEGWRVVKCVVTLPSRGV